MAPLKIEMTGEAELSLSPELAVVTLHVEDKGEDQKTVVTTVQQATAAIQKHLEPLSTNSTSDRPSPILRWSSGAMSTQRYDEFAYDETTRQSKRIRQVFRASLDVIASFRDFHVLSESTRELGENPALTIRNVEWILTPETQKALRATAVKQAFDDAQDKATTYALAAGKSVATAIEIRDGEVAHAGYGQSRMLAMARGGGGGGEEEQLTLEYVPEDVKYTTSCTVVFHAE